MLLGTSSLYCLMVKCHVFILMRSSNVNSKISLPSVHTWGWQKAHLFAMQFIQAIVCNSYQLPKYSVCWGPQAVYPWYTGTSISSIINRFRRLLSCLLATKVPVTLLSMKLYMILTLHLRNIHLLATLVQSPPSLTTFIFMIIIPQMPQP